MIAALGAFDGFHIGHVRLFETARKRAMESRDCWGAITFCPHPQALFNGTAFRYLFTETERDSLRVFHRIPRLERIPFTRNLADMKPGDFLDWIANTYTISGLVVGDNFRFGRGRTGDCQFLKTEASMRNWTVDVLPPVRVGHDKVSSTLIRKLVTMGEMRLAETLLGHPFFLSGGVVRGDQRGRSLGFPTANMSIPDEKLVPQRGVFSAAALVGGKWHPAALNIGFNPTFTGIRSLRVEAHLINFEGDLYGRHIIVLLLDHLRGELQFPSVPELVLQMRQDIASAGEHWRNYSSRSGAQLERLAESFKGIVSD